MTHRHNNQQKIYMRFICLLLIAMQLNGCAFIPWEKSVDKTKVSESQVIAAKENLAKEPEAVVKRKNLLVTTELASTKLFAEAEQARTKGNYDEAIALYDKVLSFLPDDPNAQKGKFKVERELLQSKKLSIAKELIESNKLDDAKESLHQVLLEDPLNAKALSLQQQLNEKSPPSSSRPPQLKPQIDIPVTLELRDANIKVVFEALSRATGINFVIDKDIKPDAKASVFIKKARIEDVLDMVLSSNGLQKKVLSENTVLVFSNTQQKLKEYQDLVIRSFYVSNTSAKQVAALLKSMLKTKDIFVDDRLNMIVMRDTPEAVRIAEKLVAANDLADPEVMLEIEVLEVSRSRLQELGVEFPNRIAVNSLIPITTVTSATGVVASSTVDTAAPLTLAGLLNINRNRLDVSPNPAVNFRKTTGDVNLLSNPRIRVRNNEKAKILVGDKVPIITTTSTANVGISENVTYVDVGLKLDVEPRITADNFVNIKVGLEVSSLGERTTTRNGATIFTIGTRDANTVLRLKDGETQVLAGLISDDERKNSSRLPGLGDIPLLGRLFANQIDQKSKTEIVLAITPRIISNIVRPNAEISEYWSGTESVITDKPQTNLPINKYPLSPKELFQERIRRPVRNLVEPVSIDSDQPNSQKIESNVELNPEDAPEQSQELATPNSQTPAEPTPSVDPANPPLAP